MANPITSATKAICTIRPIPTSSLLPPLTLTIATDEGMAAVGIPLIPLNIAGPTDCPFGVAVGILLDFQLTTTCVSPSVFVWSTIIIADGPHPTTIEEPTPSV